MVFSYNMDDIFYNSMTFEQYNYQVQCTMTVPQRHYVVVRLSKYLKAYRFNIPVILLYNIQ